MSGIPTMQYDAENAKCQVNVTAFNNFLEQMSFKCRSSAAPNGHLILALKG
jgi:hypothetical protein